MKFKLLFSLIVVLAGSMFLMSRHIIKQNEAINDMQERVEVIEGVCQDLGIILKYELRANKQNAPVSKE